MGADDFGSCYARSHYAGEDALSLSRAAGWFALGLAALPPVTLLHELGHLLTLGAFGGFDLQLRHSSYTGELEGEPSDVVKGTIALGGPLVSFLICALGLAAGQRFPLRRLWLALSLGAAVHFIFAMLGGLANLIGWLAPSLEISAGHDALDVATALRLPYLLVVAANSSVGLGVWWAVLRAIAAEFGRSAATWSP